MSSENNQKEKSTEVKSSPDGKKTVKSKSTQVSGGDGGGSGSSFPKVLVGCAIALFLCCCITVVGFGVLWQQGSSIISSSLGGQGRDESLTRVDSQELNEITQGESGGDTGQSGQPNLEDIGNAETVNGQVQVTLTEKELLAVVLADAQGLDPQSVGIDIEPGTMIVELDLVDAISAYQEQGADASLDGINPDLTEGLVFRMEFISTDAGQIELERLTTGSDLVDSFIPETVRTDFTRDINNSLGAESIEFQKDQVVVTLNQSNLQQ